MTNLSFFDKDFGRFFVGFDEHINQIQRLHNDINKSNYPPYNIRKTSESLYSIELAVAGFSQEQIDIEVEGGKLHIRGNIDTTEGEDNFIHRGIAARAFTRTFIIKEDIKVTGAELKNGMLTVILEHVIPEEKKPKKIAIRNLSEPQLLQG